MTKTVTIEEAEGHLAELVESIGENDEVILEKSGQPIAKVVALRASKPAGRRVFGQCRGEVWVSEDFNEPLPDDFWLGGNP